MTITNRFIKVTTNLSKAEVDAILTALSTEEKQEIISLYDNFSHVETIEADGTVSMFASIHQNVIADVFDLYVKMGIDFKYEDITERVLFSCFESTGYPEVSTQLDDLAKSYVDNNLDVDTVLDKINKVGNGSTTCLNDKDREVLATM
jgi:hypothetical protein